MKKYLPVLTRVINWKKGTRKYYVNGLRVKLKDVDKMYFASKDFQDFEYKSLIFLSCKLEIK